MINSVRFFVSCVPPKTTAQQKGAFVSGGKVRFFKKTKVAATEGDYYTFFREHVPAQPFEGAVRLHVLYVWPWRKSETKRNMALGIIPMETKPDFDNLSKTLCDMMTKMRFWTDDTLVCDGRIRKFWGSVPGIAVIIEQVDQANLLDGVPEDFARIIKGK